PDPPRLTNRFDRGQFEASRRDRIAYVVERPGHYPIPAQTISWWNTRTQTLQTEIIPAVDLRVKPTFRQRLIQLLPGLVGLLAALGGAMYFRRSLQSRWQTYRHRQNTSAAARWQRLRRACPSNDPQATWRGLNDWLISTSCMENMEPLTLEPWLNQVNSAPLTEAVRELEALLFAPTPENFAPDSSLEHSSPDSSIEPVRPWSGEALLKALTAIWPSRQSQLQPRFAVATDLPPLNPLEAQGEGEWVKQGG
ncbi:MAG: protein BatD, partial [Leptolyngbyaceae cyanobacterium SM2_3_12]|nr:protein BatD [Leptolyngbyaceae cyanobacterium SM2_3_12]